MNSAKCIQLAVPRRKYLPGFALLTAALLACAGCSHSLSHEELQTDFRASISLATETEAFLTHLNGHSYSPHFIQGHLAYLQKQGSQIQSNLTGVSVPNQDASSLDALKQETADLTHALNDLQSHAPNASSRPSSIGHLRSIRERLQSDMPR